MSNIAAQNISASNESIEMDDSIDKLKNGDLTSEFVAKISNGGELADQRCDSIPNFTNQITSAGDAIDSGLMSSALLVPEPNVIVSCQSTSDDSMENTAFPVEESIGSAVEIDMKRSSSNVSVENPEILEEPIFERCDEADTVICTASKSKRRSVWKRTKCFFRRQFFCGEIKARNPSSGIIAEQTDFVDDIGSLPVTREPILIDLTLNAEDFLSQTTSRVDRIDSENVSIAIDCETELKDLQTTLLEEEFSGPVKTVIDQSNFHTESHLNDHTASMRILDLPTESAGDKHDIDEWPPAMIEEIKKISAISMEKSPRSADEYQQQTSFDIEELSGPINTNAERPMYGREGPLYKRFISMMTLDLPTTESNGEKFDTSDWPPDMIEVIEPISVIETPRSTDLNQLDTTLQIEELNDQIETDARQSSCDHVGLPNQDTVSDLIIIEDKPKHRALWKRILCCCC